MRDLGHTKQNTSMILVSGLVDGTSGKAIFWYTKVLQIIHVIVSSHSMHPLLASHPPQNINSIQGNLSVAAMTVPTHLSPTWKQCL